MLETISEQLHIDLWVFVAENLLDLLIKLLSIVSFPVGIDLVGRFATLPRLRHGLPPLSGLPQLHGPPP